MLFQNYQSNHTFPGNKNLPNLLESEEMNINQPELHNSWDDPSSPGRNANFFSTRKVVEDVQQWWKAMKRKKGSKISFKDEDNEEG